MTIGVLTCYGEPEGKLRTRYPGAHRTCLRNPRRTGRAVWPQSLWQRCIGLVTLAGERLRVPGPCIRFRSEYEHLK